MIIVNNNSFQEGPVINNMMEDGEDNNNNGDINGNSEMIDLHDRRIHEERERELQVRERNANSIEELVVIQERNIVSDRIASTQSHDINLPQISIESVQSPEEGASADTSKNTNLSEDKSENLAALSNVNNPQPSLNSTTTVNENVINNVSDESNSRNSESEHQSKNSDDGKSLDEL